MGGRYLASGVQLGELITLISLGKREDANKLVNSIIENQFIGNSTNSIAEDIVEMNFNEDFCEEN